MSNKNFLIASLFALLLAACNEKKKEESKKEDISRFSWLNGNWSMKEKDGMVTEEWKTVTDSLMEGKSDFVKGDSVIPLETIRMFSRGEDFYYEAKAAGQNNEKPVQFKFSSFSDSGFIAENPAHDFPKRITYRLVNKDSIHAIVDGGPQLPDKKADFFYSRVKK